MSLSNFNLPDYVIYAYDAYVRTGQMSLGQALRHINQPVPGVPYPQDRSLEEGKALIEQARQKLVDQSTEFLPLPLDPYYFPNQRVTKDEVQFVQQLRATLSPADDNPWLIANRLAQYRQSKIAQQVNPTAGGVAGGGSAGGGGGSSQGLTNPSGSQLTPGQLNALATVRSLFPWIEALGGDAFLEKVKQWVIQGFQPEGIVANLRQTPEYQRLFPGIRNPDGTMKMQEAQYLQRREEYKQLLRQYGLPDYQYDDPNDTAVFFQNDIDPNELKQRLETYDAVRRNRWIKDAFYVYAGLRVTDDDLYQAVVNPLFREDLGQRYLQAVGTQQIDYDTFLKRAAEVGLDRVAESLATNPPPGSTGVVPVLQRATLDDIKGYLAQLHMGTTGKPLSLNELLHAFEAAVLGSTAIEQGLQLPSMERIEEFRQMGVDRARAMEAYSLFAQRGQQFAGAVQRANLGTGFTQSQFEEATLLNRAEQTQLLSRALDYEKALAQRAGGFGFSFDRTGRLRQGGLRVPGQGL
jgi:hypothetical protein